MRLIIAAAGKLKDAEERGICQRYAKRLNVTGKGIGLGPLEIIELSESRAASVDARKADEALRLLKAAGETSLKIALDVEGKSYSSEAFAKLIGQQRDSGVKTCAFIVGGPDGHGPDVLKASEFKMSLTALTMPHGLARVVLIEQLYRIATILTGHPYHRS